MGGRSDGSKRDCDGSYAASGHWHSDLPVRSAAGSCRDEVPAVRKGCRRVDAGERAGTLEASYGRARYSRGGLWFANENELWDNSSGDDCRLAQKGLRLQDEMR
jgi:hypothetical protein